MRKAKSYYDKAANADNVSKKESERLLDDKKSRGRICKASIKNLTLKKGR